MAFQAGRLLNVARALRESPNPKVFTMAVFGHCPDDENTCATPACALEEAAEYIENFVRNHPENRHA